MSSDIRHMINLQARYDGHWLITHEVLRQGSGTSGTPGSTEARAQCRGMIQRRIKSLRSRFGCFHRLPCGHACCCYNIERKWGGKEQGEDDWNPRSILQTEQQQNSDESSKCASVVLRARNRRMEEVCFLLDHTPVSEIRRAQERRKYHSCPSSPINPGAARMRGPLKVHLAFLHWWRGGLTWRVHDARATLCTRRSSFSRICLLPDSTPCPASSV